ncbi:hypothetical protein N0X72_25465 [Streptomyces carpaticus]|uniref:hypothetical protein n=1 Tax=Streptomyces carpaticus TaxID=285558 RepID=UPI002204D88B|nr:hypothetical protein N0X72_25465 [Streptomyces carpaticus]
MAYIAHRCTCGHLPAAHPQTGRCTQLAGRSCPGGPCSARRAAAPEIVPTWDAAGRPVTTIAAPGERLPGIGDTCDCAACTELYEQQTAA